jgi:hypothetical protein
MLHYSSCAAASLSLRSSNSRVSEVNRAPSRRRVRSRGPGYLHARQVRTALLSFALIREKLTIFALLHFLQAPGGAVGCLFSALDVLIFRPSFDVDLGTQSTSRRPLDLLSRCSCWGVISRHAAGVDSWRTRLVGKTGHHRLRRVGGLILVARTPGGRDAVMCGSWCTKDVEKACQRALTVQRLTSKQLSYRIEG